MASKKIREIDIIEKKGVLSTVFKKFEGKKSDYDFKSLTILRRILSNEKLRILHSIKIKKPSSIYELSRILKRDYRAVLKDIKLLEKFGFIEMVLEKSGKRNKLKPTLVIDTMQINISI